MLLKKLDLELVVKLSIKKLEEAPLPCVLHWNNNHYVVVKKVKMNKYLYRFFSVSIS